MFVSDEEIKIFLAALASDGAADAWMAFLADYSDLIYSVVRPISRNSDDAADCFLFTCEGLAANSYRRLRAFRPNGRARFSTWLRAVVRNLSLDWYRSRFGRRRLFRVALSRDAIDQEIFHAVFTLHLTTEEVCRRLFSGGSTLSYAEVESKVEEFRRMLSSRQLWLLSTATPASCVSNPEQMDEQIETLMDASPGPEDLALLRDIQRKVTAAVCELDSTDRLLLRLRFDEELGLREVAVLVGLKDAQTADRRIRDALERIRGKLGLQPVPSGKRKSASV